MSTRYQLRYIPSGHVLNQTFGSMTAAHLYLLQTAPHSAHLYAVEPFELMEALGFRGGEVAEIVS